MRSILALLTLVSIFFGDSENRSISEIDHYGRRRIQNWVNWVPLFNWSKYRHDPWLAGHPRSRMWSYGLYIPHRITVTEIKRKTNRDLQSKWSKFLRKSRLLGKLKGYSANEFKRPFRTYNILSVADRFPKTRSPRPNSRLGSRASFPRQFHAAEKNIKFTHKNDILSIMPQIEKSDITQKDDSHKFSELIDLDENVGVSQDQMNLRDDSFDTNIYENESFEPSFGEFVENPPDTFQTSAVSCDKKQSTLCTRESDCACNGTWMCLSGKCSTQALQSSPNILEDLMFVKKTASP